MTIQQLDQNFKIETDVTEPDLVWFNTRELPFSLHGVMYDEVEKRFLRIPQKIAEKVSQGVEELNRNTAGGRVRFRTNSSFIAIRVMMNESRAEYMMMPHMPRTGQSGFDLYRILDGKETYFTTFIPPASWKDGYSSSARTYGELADYTINFPLYDGVKELYIGIKKNAILEEATPYKYDVPIVFYGNSITQGGCASRPGNSYQGFLSRRFSMDFVNLGFSGNGKGEPEMAEYIANMNMSAFVMDYNFNAPTEEHLRATHYNFYKIVRDANPNLPIIFLSHSTGFYITSAFDEWGTFEGRCKIIEETYERAKVEGDENVYFVDGKEIVMCEEGDACTVDRIHPNDLGFYRIAMHIEEELKKFLEPIIQK